MLSKMALFVLRTLNHSTKTEEFIEVVFFLLEEKDRMRWFNLEMKYQDDLHDTKDKLLEL